MRIRGAGSRVEALSRLALLGLIAGGSAACSSDALRFGDPFGNPFSTRGAAEPGMTGSLPDKPLPSAPATRTPSVQSQPLAAPSGPAAPQPAPVARTSAPAPVTSGQGGWTAQGGTSITVGPGDGLAQLSNRFGVPASAILSANGLSAASQVTPGRQVVIPVYSATGTPAPASRAVSVPVERKEALKPVLEQKKVARAEGTGTGAKKHPRPGQAPEARVAARAPESAKAKPVEVKPVEVKPVEVKPAKVEASKARPSDRKAEASKPEPKKAEPVKVARIEPPKTAPVMAAPVKTAPVKAAPVPAVEAKPAPAPVEEPRKVAATDSKASFRWPANGRVINGYGSSGNEGINIAVPEGTPVKAAEEGTVAYAGSDVKGYGKLVLIRHPNGYVSAYAHNGELDVKPGEKVRRGQTIAKSGQSGNVTSPQLHFEIRSGATPVDPMPHLASN